MRKRCFYNTLIATAISGYFPAIQKASGHLPAYHSHKNKCNIVNGVFFCKSLYMRELMRGYSLIEMAENPSQYFPADFPGLLDRHVSEGYSLMHSHYHLVCRILATSSPLEPRLDMCAAIIHHPAFKCVPSKTPEVVVRDMCLHARLFRESFFYPKKQMIFLRI